MSYIKKNPDWGAKTKAAKAYRKARSADPTWRRKTALKLEAREARRKEHEWLKTNWYNSDRILNELDITYYTFNKIKEALQLVPKISGASVEHIFSPQDFERIKNYSFPEIEIIPPRGYKTREEIQEQFSIFIDSKIKRHGIKPKHKKWRGQDKQIRNIYRPEDIVEWLEEIERAKVKKNEERKKQTKERREREYEQKVSNAQKAIEGLDVVRPNEAAKMLGVKIAQPLLQDKCIKVLGRCYYRRSDVKMLIKERQRKKELKKQERKKYNYHKLRPDDWTSWQSYEKRRKELAQLYLETGYNAGNRPYKERGVKSNLDIWEKHDGGEIVHFECVKCNKNLPYYDFYFDPTYQRGRRNDCKICNKRNQSIPEEHNPRTPSRFITTYTMSIRRSLTKRNKKYCTLASTQIWHLLEKHLGYNRNDLVRHLKSKFTKRMKWSNHGRPTKPNQFRWQTDHIKPRSSFSYTSIEDDDFKECWALENLLPMEAKMNYYKSNKKLMQLATSDLRKAIKTGKESVLFKHLPYTATQLQEHFISLGAIIEDCGSTWTIDHIIPQAAKPFQSFDCPNFQTLLALDNLQPLSRSKNATKGSKYQDKYWYHNCDK